MVKDSAHAGRVARGARSRRAKPTVVPLPTIVDIDGLGEIDDTPVLPDENDVASPQAALEQLLKSARRRVVPIRRTFVQLSRENEERTGNLSRLVAARQHVALDLLLLLIALFPVIGPDDPIAGKTWARLLSSPTHKRSPATVSRTWAVLEELGLVRWTPGRPVQLLCEDGSGEPYIHPGNSRGDAGYFGLPRRYWLDGWHHRLDLPAKAMLLVILAETNNPATPTFGLSTEKIAEYYGLSVSTVRRGLAQLEELGLLGEKWQKVPAPRSTTGFTYRTHRWLKNPFSTAYRQAARDADGVEARRRGGKSSTAAQAAPGGEEVKSG